MTLEPFAAVAQRRRSLRPASPDAMLAVIAAVLLPLGLLVILLGWYGAAHTPYLFEQVPYLISGGLIGLGLVITGGMLFFGSWIAKGAAAQREASAELADLLREVRDELAVRPAARSAASATRKDSNGHAAFVATASGSMLHRRECSVVTGREDLRSVSTTSGLKPCGLCNPLTAEPTSV